MAIFNSYVSLPEDIFQTTPRSKHVQTVLRTRHLSHGSGISVGLGEALVRREHVNASFEKTCILFNKHIDSIYIYMYT